MLEVEFMYFSGCPAWERAWAELGRALVELDVSACVRLHDITNLNEMEKGGFAGSPTIRIDGRDLEDYYGPPVMACRRYLDNDGLGWPSQALLQERVRAALAAHH